MLARPIEHIIFDWNGTLIDDLALAVRGVNHAAAPLGIPPIDEATYRRHFGFPVQDFYSRIGFDFEQHPFATTVATYLSVFDANVCDCPLQPGAQEVIAWARDGGLSVSILSASHHDTLHSTLRHHGLGTGFDHVMGLQDTSANSKLALAAELDARLGRPGGRALMVGDTVHDLEVARAHGWQAVIVPRGHQGPEHFTGHEVAIVPDLHALARWPLAGSRSTSG